MKRTNLKRTPGSVFCYKFLTPYGSTTQYGLDSKAGETFYILPRPDQKWSDPMNHPTPAEADGNACGRGRFHGMLKPSADYAPTDWWIWAMEVSNIVGQDNEKVSGTTVRLRMIPRRVFWRMIRLGICSNANLRGANLRGADLREADLSEANLREADLREADLREADLRGADLRGANLGNIIKNKYTVMPE